VDVRIERSFEVNRFRSKMGENERGMYSASLQAAGLTSIFIETVANTSLCVLTARSESHQRAMRRMEWENSLISVDQRFRLLEISEL
jgi:hypothetical protein